jgi:hypothetical protein
MNEKFTLLSKVASEWSRRLLHQTLRMSPTSPPQIARKRPSQSNCLMPIVRARLQLAQAAPAWEFFLCSFFT